MRAPAPAVLTVRGVHASDVVYRRTFHSQWCEGISKARTQRGHRAVRIRVFGNSPSDLPGRNPLTHALGEQQEEQISDNRAMLRDKNLVPLSRQHQHALALCVRINRATLSSPEELQAWQAEIQQHFEQEIQYHFSLLPGDILSSRTSLKNSSPSMPSCEIISGRRLRAASIKWGCVNSRKHFRPTSARKRDSCLKGFSNV